MPIWIDAQQLQFCSTVYERLKIFYMNTLTHEKYFCYVTWSLIYLKIL